MATVDDWGFHPMAGSLRRQGAECKQGMPLTDEVQKSGLWPLAGFGLGMVAVFHWCRQRGDGEAFQQELPWCSVACKCGASIRVFAVGESAMRHQVLGVGALAAHFVRRCRPGCAIQESSKGSRKRDKSWLSIADLVLSVKVASAAMSAQQGAAPAWPAWPGRAPLVCQTKQKGVDFGMCCCCCCLVFYRGARQPFQFSKST